VQMDLKSTLTVSLHVGSNATNVCILSCRSCIFRFRSCIHPLSCINYCISITILNIGLFFHQHKKQSTDNITENLDSRSSLIIIID